MLTADTTDGNNSSYANLNAGGGSTGFFDITYSEIANSNGYFEMIIPKKVVTLQPFNSNIPASGNVTIDSNKVICFGGLKDYSSVTLGVPVELAIIDQ
jgi:hypothetical protein